MGGIWGLGAMKRVSRVGFGFEFGLWAMWVMMFGEGELVGWLLA